MPPGILYEFDYQKYLNVIVFCERYGVTDWQWQLQNLIYWRYNKMLVRKSVFISTHKVP